MKKKSIIGYGIILFSIGCGYTYGYQQQGFTTYIEGTGGISATCSRQCAIVVDKLGSSDVLSLGGDIAGQGQIAWGYLVGGQVYIIGNQPVTSAGLISTSADLKNNVLYHQITSDPDIIVILEGNIQIKNFEFNLTIQSIGEKIRAGFISALQSISYSPRTINFVEGPLWNGIYINQAFVPKLFLLLLFLGIGYFVIIDKRKKIYRIMIGVFFFYWILIDFFATKHQLTWLQQVQSNKNSLMKNARLGQGSDFYDILEKIKEITPHGTQGFIMAPYPFSFEGKYHLYPHFRVSTFTGASVVFYYNTMGAAAEQFGFVEPVFSTGQGGAVMMLGNDQILIDKKIDITPYAKIYFIKK